VHRRSSDDGAVAEVKQLVIDGRHAPGLARFWAAALDGFEVRGHDDAEITRLASLGLTPETDPCVLVDGPNLELCFQEVEVAVIAKTPVHLDLATPSRTIETERLVGLGATRSRRLHRTRGCAIPKATTSASPTRSRRSGTGAVFRGTLQDLTVTVRGAPIAPRRSVDERHNDTDAPVQRG
jgi:hypothetical protein